MHQPDGAPGRPRKITDPVKIQVWVERATRDQIPGDGIERADWLRDAIEEKLRREKN